MIIYNLHSDCIIANRIERAERILKSIPQKHCFVTGSFLYKEKYNDIDIFVITRSKKNIVVDEEKANVTLIDFNDLHSLFYHSISKSCIAKNILPAKPLKVTMSDYWDVINEAVPTLLNQKQKYHKTVRFLVLYTEYLRTGNILDTLQLDMRIASFRDYRAILDYIDEEVPKILRRRMKKSYLRRFFYTRAGIYKDLLGYRAQSFLYGLCHAVTHA